MKFGFDNRLSKDLNQSRQELLGPEKHLRCSLRPTRVGSSRLLDLNLRIESPGEGLRMFH